MLGKTPAAQGQNEGSRRLRNIRIAQGFMALASATIASVASAPAWAQSFSQAIVFGDSTVDSGFYKTLGKPKGGAAFDNAFAAAIAAGGTGAPTSGGALMNSQILAGYFGLTADPANQPGGTNLATSGAKTVLVNTPANGGFGAAIPTVQQVENYLASVGGQANSNGLYLISSGNNDLGVANGSGNPIQFMQNTADTLANEIVKLHAAGARTIIIPTILTTFPSSTSPNILPVATQQAGLAYDKELWSSLKAQGVNFIPADINSVVVAIVANPSSFGFQFIGTNQAACTTPAGIATSFSLLCTSNTLNNPTNPNPQSHLKASADAGQTHLFADDAHFAAAGQQIQADYFYSLLVAPSEISFLAENAVQSRTITVAGIQDQMSISRQRQTSGFNVWFNGDVSSLKINNPAPGFPGDPSTPLSGTVALDYKWIEGYLLGGAFTTGRQTPSFALGGEFSQDEIAGSIYSGIVEGPVWASVIASYSGLRYDVNRIVPIGITLQGNTAKTNGSNLSFAFQGGYDFIQGNLTHGPIAGVDWQRVRTNGFTETGGFTALSFGDQTRNSTISAIGYKATYDLGRFHPYAQLVWNHEFAGRHRTVTASLTTIDAPSFTLPAVLLGQDWGTGTLGTTMTIGRGFTGITSFTAQAGQTGVTTYGGRVGLNYAIN